MKRIIILILAMILAIALLGGGYYMMSPRTILTEAQANSLEGMQVYYAQEPEMAIPPPYTAFARLVHIISPDFDKKNLGESASYSPVYTMDETLETQLVELLKTNEMKMVLGSGKKAFSDEYAYHLECLQPGGEKINVHVGSDDLPCLVEIGGRQYQILQDEAFRKSFEESVWDYLTAQILDRAWEKGEHTSLETRPMGWTLDFSEGSETISIRLLFYRSMESGNLSVSFDGQTYDSVGAESIMYGVKGSTGSVRSAEMNFFCEYDGTWLYISGLDLSAGTHEDCVYKVNLKTGMTLPTVQRAPALRYEEKQRVFYNRDEPDSTDPLD